MHIESGFLIRRDSSFSNILRLNARAGVKEQERVAEEVPKSPFGKATHHTANWEAHCFSLVPDISFASF